MRIIVVLLSLFGRLKMIFQTFIQDIVQSSHHVGSHDLDLLSSRCFTTN